MSDVLIKGMEMPSCCAECLFCNSGDEFSDDWYCEALHGERLSEKQKTGIKRADCPLVEVKPHGRLIDLNAVAEMLENEWGYEGSLEDLQEKIPCVLEASDA